MENNLTNQLIEEYLTDRLNAEAKHDFELNIAKDQSLKEEVEIQKQIIFQIKEARRIELKNRLKNIDINPSYDLSRWKYAAVGFLALISISTFYYLFKPSENSSPNPHTPTTVKTIEPLKIKKIPVLASKETESESVTKANTNKSQNIVTSPIKIKKEKNINTPKNQDIDEPNSEDLQFDIELKNESDKIGIKNIKSELEVSVLKDKKNRFHYQYFNSKLYLICDFEDQPYEVIEMTNKSNQSLYLLYKNEYYEMKPNTTQASPLKKVLDNDKINQLELLRFSK